MIQLPSARKLPGLWLLPAVMIVVSIAGAAAGCGGPQPEGKAKREELKPCPKRDYRTPCWFDKEKNRYYRF